MADVKVSIGADASQFNKELAGVKAKVNHFAKDQLGELKGQLATAFTVGAVIELGKATIALGDHIGDLALRMNLSAESVQKLDFAAKQNGTTIDAVAKAFNKLSVAIHDGVGGNEKTLDSFKNLGVSLEDLQSMTAEQVFMKIADAVKNSTDPTMTMADAVKVLGKGASELVPLLLEGSAGITALGEKAEKAGAIMSGETVAALKQMNDQLEALKAQGQAAFAPILTNLAKGLKLVVDYTKAWSGLLGAMSVGGAGGKAAALNVLEEFRDGGKVETPHGNAAKAAIFREATDKEADKDAKKAEREEEARVKRIARLKEEIEKARVGNLSGKEKREALNTDLQGKAESLFNIDDEEKRLEVVKDILAIKKEIMALDRQDAAEAKKVEHEQVQENRKMRKQAETLNEIEAGKGVSVSGVITDSLARIGGSVGQGGDPGMREAERQTQIQEKMLEALEKIADEKADEFADATSGV